MEGRGETAIWIFCLTDSTLLPPFQRIIYTWMATVRCNCMLSPNMLEFQAVEFFLHSWYFWPNFLLLEYEKVQNPCLKDSTFSGYLFRSELWWISLSGRKARPWVIKTCVKRSFFSGMAIFYEHWSTLQVAGKIPIDKINWLIWSRHMERDFLDP